MQKQSFREMPLVALFAALTAIGAFVRVPIPFVPFTLQLLFCLLAGFLLGPRGGLFSQMLYVGMGLIGLPVFTAGGGPGYVLQPTFGYLLGFIACAWIVGTIAHGRSQPSFACLFGAALAGLGVVYALGVPWLYGIFNFWLQDSRSVSWAVYYGFAVSIGGDLVIAFLTATLAFRLLPVVHKYPSVSGEEGQVDCP